MTITIDLTAEEEQHLTALIHQSGLTAADLAHIAVREMLRKPASDVQAVIDRVFEKNAELFKRLS